MVVVDSTLELESQQEEDRLILRAHGSLTSQAFVAKALDMVTGTPSVNDVIIVLDDVDYINSEGFGSLIVFAEQLEAQGKSFSIVGLRKKVQVVFSSLGASNMLNVFPNLELCLEDLSERKKQ